MLRSAEHRDGNISVRRFVLPRIAVHGVEMGGWRDRVDTEYAGICLPDRRRTARVLRPRREPEGGVMMSTLALGVSCFALGFAVATLIAIWFGR